MLHSPLQLQWPNQERYACLFQIDASTKRCTHIVAWNIKNKGWYEWIPQRFGSVQFLIFFSNERFEKKFQYQSFFLSLVIHIKSLVIGLDDLPFPNVLKNIVISYNNSRTTTASVIVPTEYTVFLVNHFCRIRWQGTSQYSHVKISIFKDTWHVLFDWEPNEHLTIWKPLKEGTFRLLFEFKSQDEYNCDWIESEQFVCHDTEKEYKDICSLCDYFDFGLEVQIFKLCNNVFGSNGKLDVNYMHGGGYNSVANIKNILSGSEYVLRMPKSKIKHINFINRIFQSLYLSCVFPPNMIPKLIAFDARCHNAIGNQYTIETKLNGTCLSYVFDDELEFHQRCCLAREVAHFLIFMFSIQQESCGPIVAPLPFSYSKDSKICIGRKCWRKEFSVASFHYETFDPNYRLPRTLREYLEFHLRDMALVSKKKIYSALFHLVSNDIPSFSPSFNCLTHLDFFKRNILVTMQDNKMPKISGVCDWDDCEFLPKELAFLCVPQWLWEEPSELLFACNLDDESLSEQNTRIRDIFVDTMQTKFKDYKHVITTMNKYPNLIRVARLAYFGDNLCCDSVEAKTLFELLKKLPNGFALFNLEDNNFSLDVQRTKNVYRLLDFKLRIFFKQQQKLKKS